MKKLILAAGILLLLSGCGTQPTFETVSDEYVQPVSVQLRQIALELPEDAAALTAQSDGAGNLYFCDGYTVTVQMVEAGDLDRTLRQTTGFGKEALALMETEMDGVKRWEGIWTAAGEGEDQVGRVAVLDDGVSHYVLTCMAGASKTEEVQPQWQALFSSFRLLSEEELLHTGS